MARVTYRTVYPLAAVRGRRPSVDDKRSAEKDRKDAAIRATALNSDPQLIHDSHTYAEHQRIALRLPLKNRTRFSWDIKPGGSHGKADCFREARFTTGPLSVALRLPTGHHHHQGHCCRKTHPRKSATPRQARAMGLKAPRHLNALRQIDRCAICDRPAAGTGMITPLCATHGREFTRSQPTIGATAVSASGLVPDGQGGHIWHIPNS